MHLPSTPVVPDTSTTITITTIASTINDDSTLATWWLGLRGPPCHRTQLQPETVVVGWFLTNRASLQAPHPPYTSKCTTTNNPGTPTIRSHTATNLGRSLEGLWISHFPTWSGGSGVCNGLDFTYMCFLNGGMSLYVWLILCMCMYVRVNMFMYVDMFVCMFVCVPLDVCTCVYVGVCQFVLVFINISGYLYHINFCLFTVIYNIYSPFIHT